MIFDWGDTLSGNDKDGVPILSYWAGVLLKKLYASCYRLAIISNTHRYSDAWWIRKQLAKHGVLQEFECIVSSATYAIHKPDPRIFQKVIDFMQIDPFRAVMVGDSKNCDGAAQFHGMSYLRVEKGERWDKRLYDLLGDSFPENRKLSNLYEYTRQGDTVITKMRHFSLPVKVGDVILIDGVEQKILTLNTEITSDLILKHHQDDLVTFTVGNPMSLI